MSGIHPLDFVAIAAYLAVVIYLGKRASHGSSGQEGYFLAGRKLGKAYQFFLNFGNATDANGAVSTASIVYRQGASGVWHALQTLFMNPYYWFMNLWFRRVRLVTVADLFEDRFGGRALSLFYAGFQVVATVVVIIGFGNFIGYKVTSSLMVKPEASWSVEERRAVQDYREYQGLEALARGTSELGEKQAQRLGVLRERNKRGELHSYVSYLHSTAGKWIYYIIYTSIVGAYIVMGGLAAAAVNEAFQGILIVVFSIMLIPFGLSAIGGWDALSEKITEPGMFDVLVANPKPGTLQVTFWTLLAILFVSIIQIHGIIGNMSVAGSARNEYAARFGAVSGTYAKRIMIILWAICGLIAVAMFQGATELSDPDSAWGTMALVLLKPGLLGLMMAGLLAANMSTVAAQTMAVSALFARNIYAFFKRDASESQLVAAGRWAIVVILAIGVVAAVNMDDAFTQIQLLLTVQVPFGAAVFLMFFWRRLTRASIWCAVIISAGLNILFPQVAEKLPGLRDMPAWTVQGDESGVPTPVYWDKVVRQNALDLSSPLQGAGRFHVELVILDKIGIDPVAMDTSGRYAARFFFDGIFPFVVLIGVSLLTRAPDKPHSDQFFGKMKTSVGETPELEALAVAETRLRPDRFDHKKLLGPRSNWEFTKWDRTDTVGFLVCCCISAGIFLAFKLILTLAAG